MMAKPADKNIQSGNSRVKVTIYGQVNRAVRFANTGDNTEITSVDNDGSGSRIGVRAVGKANANLSVGSLTEFEWRDNARSGTNAGNDGGVGIRTRHVDLWLDHKDIGKLSMGHGSMAGDAAGLYELTGVSFVYGFAGANGTDGTKADASVKTLKVNDGATPVTDADTGDFAPASVTMDTVSATGKPRGFRPFNFFGFRQNRIRYDTPSLMGLRASASYGENKTWSVGLSFAGAPPGVKNFSALFAAGYRKNDDDSTAWAVSGGIKHSSGFNISASYDGDGEANSMGFKNSQWGVSGGWGGKINDAGGTSIGIGYNRSSDGMHGKAQQYWVAIVQKVDAAAADVYAGVSYDSGTVTHTVSEAEAATADRAYDSTTNTAAPPITALEQAGSPCYSMSGVNFIKAAEGDTCEVARDGVINFVAGVRLKF